MSDYWVQRKRDSIYNKQLNIAEKELGKEYRRCAGELKEKMESLYDEIMASAVDGSLLVSDLYKYNRYFDLMNDMNQKLNKLGLKEIEITEDCLRNMYLVNSQQISEEMGFFTAVNEDAVNKALEAVWCPDGKHWSQRVWANKAGLAELLKEGMVNSIARGASKDELVADLMESMGVGFREADRIARTELNFIQNQSTFDKYIEAGVDEYKFLAEIDTRTSDICKEQNGKIFKLSEAEVGVNYPPLHPNCRSTVLAIL